MSVFDLPTVDPITRGDYERIAFTVEKKGQPGVPQDLSGYTLKFGAKDDVSTVTPLMVKDSTVPDNFEIIDAAAGRAAVIIQPEDTQGFTFEQTLICDIQVTDSNGRPATTTFRLPVKLDVSA